MRRSLALASLAFALSGCPTDDMTDVGAADGGADAAPPRNPYAPECEGLDPADCLLPWPSSRYLRTDATTDTGLRIDIPIEAMPTNIRRIPVDPTMFERFDGFSAMTSMVTVLPEGTDYGIFADEEHIEDSLSATSPTVLLEISATGTATRVAHFAEPDSWPRVLASERPFYIRPAARLREGTRYVVAIRNVVTEAGAPIDAQPYFRALRDRTPFADAPDLEGRRADFDEIFGLLEGAGVQRNSLFVAWDFTTGTGETAWRDLITMRDAAHEALDAMPASCTIEDTVMNPDPNIARRISGTVRVPLFLEGIDPSSPTESAINRDSMGLPAQNGWADVPFLASIPNSVVASVAGGGAPGRLLNYGHGLFGSRGETQSGAIRRTLEDLEMVGIAVDWWGMSEDDVPRVGGTLTEMSSFASTPERLCQGLINFEILTRSIRQSCFGPASPTNPFYVTPTAGGAPVLVFDPDERYYAGNSQGGIMGQSLAAISVEMERFVTGVAGISYAIMIPRSSNWQVYDVIMRNGYRSQLHRALLMTMAQSLWDLSEPATYAPHILRDTLPCTLDGDRCPGGLTPPHHVLFHAAENDDQVAHITADIAARTIGLPVMLPAPYMPYGLMPVTTPTVPDALMLFAIPGTPDLPLGTRDPGTAPNPAHGGPRGSDAALRQMDAFFRPDGVVTVTCDGLCDPS